MDALSLLLAKGIAVLVSTPPAAGKVRKGLSADALYELVRNAFGRLPDHRHEKAAIPLADAIGSALAIVLAQGPFVAGVRRASQRSEHEDAVRHRPDPERHADARDPRPAGAGPAAAGFQRRVSPTATRQGLGALCVSRRRLLASTGRHRLFLLEQSALRFLFGEEKQTDRRGDVPASDAGGGEGR